MFLRKSIENRTRTSLSQEGIWSDEKRIEAVATYIALGSMAETHRVTTIPLNTLWSWKQQGTWWKDVEQALRAEKNNETSTKLNGIVNKTLEAIVDRVDNGDYLYDQRTGDIKRIPVTSASLNKIATTLLDRRLTLDKMEVAKVEEEVDSTAKLEKQLTKLADSFAKFVSSKKREEKVIEGEIVAG